jgi:hypothetical protein
VAVELQVDAIMAKVVSVVESLAVVETVNGGDNIHVVGAGLRASVSPERIASPPGSSGLDSASVVLTVRVRLFDRVFPTPVDEFSTDLLKAIGKVCGAYLGGFTLGGLVRDIDLHGRHGQAMTVQAGYMDVPDGTCRVMTLLLPLVIDNAWEEVA